MRVFILALHVFVAVLVTSASPLPPTDIANTTISTEPVVLDTTGLDHQSPLNERRGSKKKRPASAPNGRSKPQAVGKTAPTAPTLKGGSTVNGAASANGAASGNPLADAVHNFDMAVKLIMAEPPATGTNSITAAVMEEVLKKATGVPKSSTQPVQPPSLSLRHGKFQAIVHGSLLRVKDTTRVPSAIALLQSAKAAKKQYQSRPISGELDMTQVIVQGLVAPATEVLAAIGHPKAYWHGVGRGGAPITDLQFAGDNKKHAVIEIKTTDSMPPRVADTIFNDFNKFTMTMLPDKLKVDADIDAKETAKEGKKVPSLVHPGDLVNPSIRHREGRGKPAKILEQAQLFSQMWSTGAMLGAITNL